MTARRRARPAQITFAFVEVGDRAPREEAEPRGARFIVPTERHVEQLVREGVAAETRASLRSRLLAALAPQIVFAQPDEARMAFAAALAKAATDEPRLSPMLRAGGAPWARVVASFDAALAALEAAGTPEHVLERIAAARGLEAWKARLLREARAGLDAGLARVGRVDPRRAPEVLRSALRDATPRAVAEAVQADRLEARWILAWDGAEVAWWRELDRKLSKLGGSARIAMPTVERPLDADRERDAFDVLADELALRLEEAPKLEPLANAWAEPGVGVEPAPELLETVEVRAASDERTQGDAAADAVASALREGVAPEKIAVVPCSSSEDVLAPLRRALRDRGVVAYDARGRDAPTGVLACVWTLLVEAPDSRRVRDRLVKSRYVRARDLEGLDEAIAKCSSIQPRASHARAARTLLALLEIAPGLGAGARASLARDEPASGIARADLEAGSRDARAWRALERAIDRYESLSLLHAPDDAVSVEVFVEELRVMVSELLDHPSGARIGAVRIARAGELALQDLERLVVVEANESAAPWSARRASLLSDALLGEIAAIAPAACPCTPALERSRELGALTLALAHARRVVLVHREREAGGGPLAPAPLVTWLARGGARVVRWSSETRRAPAAAAGRGSAARARVELARESFFFDPLRAGSPEVGDIPVDAALRAVLVDETGGGDRPLAVTALEAIATCAFRGFAQQVLRARSPDLEPDLPDAREEGTLTHEALAAAFTATRPRWAERPRDGEAILREGLAAAEKLLEERGVETGLRRLALSRTLASVAAVLAWSAADQEWDFLLAEQPFGSAQEGAWPALVVSDSLRLRGQIDRVDARHGASGARVLDYKRRSRESSRLGATSLQLPIYAVAAGSALGGPVEGGYVPFTPRDLASHRASGAHAGTMRELVSGDDPAVLKIAAELVDKMRRGALAPRPREERACTRCELDGGCRKPRFAIEPEEE
jgi:RecB family exonuclease